MSLILDALKKLEQEKKSRRARKVEIRPALTARKSGAPPPPWRLAALLGGAVTLTVIVTMGITGLVSRKNPPVASAPVQAEVVTAATPAPAAPLPSPPPTAEPGPPATPPVTVRKATPAPLPPAPKRGKVIVPETTSPPADFKVTGIAWLEERAARRAVVNGILMGEGAEVSGAKIMEIRQEQVRFTRGGRSFSVSIASANR